MFKALLKLRLREMLSQFTRRKGRGYAKNLSHGAYLILLAAVYCFVGFSIFQLFDSFAGGMVSMRLGAMYFGYSSIIGFGLALIGSVFATEAQLFEAKDNDTLLSMPIPPALILASRMISLYLQTLLYESLMMVPAAVAWFVHLKPFTLQQFLSWLVPTLFFPMIAMTVGCFLGWLLALASSHVRNKSYLQMGVSGVLLAGYFFMFSYVTSEMDGFSAGLKLITGQTLRSIWPAYQYGLACTGNWGSVANVILVSVLPLLCVWLLISKFFFHVVNEHHHVRKRVYTEKTLHVLSVRRALIQRERRQLLADGSYLLNAGMGILMVPILTIVFLIFRSDFQTIADELSNLFRMEDSLPIQEFAGSIRDVGMLLVTVLMCMIATTITISASSLSMEGKTIWHAGILPVSGKDFLMAKVYLHLLLSTPVFLCCSLVFQFCLPGSTLARILLMVSPVLMNVLIALLGMVLNVLHPKFDWTSSVQVIKRSLPVAVCLLGGFFLIAGSAMVYFQWLVNLMNPTVFLAACTLVMLLLSAGLILYLHTAGVKKLRTYYAR